MKTTRKPAVYILTNRRNGTLYIGVTSDLPKRIWNHREKTVPGFSAKYSLTRLVYYDLHATMRLAITREKQLKEWRRAWKLQLIESINPSWQDLYDYVLTASPAPSPGSRLASG